MFDLTQWDYAAICVKLAVYTCCFLATGFVIFLLVNPQINVSIENRLRTFIFAFVLVGVVASALQFGIQSGRLLDDGIIGMIDSEMLELVLNAPLGDAIVLRLLGLLMLCLFVVRAPMARVFALAGAGVVAFSFSMVGHGTEAPRLLMGSLVTIHVLAVSFWLGALWPLYAAANGSMSLIDSGFLAHRFGRQAAWVVGVLVFAGGLLTYNLVGSIALMWNSQYGLTLLVKLGLVVALLGLAAGNKLKVVPAMITNDQNGAIRLKKSIKWEAILFACILSATAVLTTVTPLPEH